MKFTPTLVPANTAAPRRCRRCSGPVPPRSEHAVHGAVMDRRCFYITVLDLIRREVAA